MACDVGYCQMGGPLRTVAYRLHKLWHPSGIKNSLGRKGPATKEAGVSGDQAEHDTRKQTTTSQSSKSEYIVVDYIQSDTITSSKLENYQVSVKLPFL